jgi:MarR family transcriptional regulator, transcriptional regulator for hemolysin
MQRQRMIGLLADTVSTRALPVDAAIITRLTICVVDWMTASWAVRDSMSRVDLFAQRRSRGPDTDEWPSPAGSPAATGRHDAGGAAAVGSPRTATCSETESRPKQRMGRSATARNRACFAVPGRKYVDVERFDVYAFRMATERPTQPIGMQLSRTAKMVSRAFDDALAAAGGSLPIWLVMVSLKAARHGMQRDLASAVGIEGPTLTHHLNRMEAAGLVQRSRDPENRRVHRVVLTAAGEAEFRRLRQTVVAFDRRLREGLDAKEIALLGSLLERLRRNVAETAAQEVP